MIPERSLRIVLLANGASIHTIRWANIFAEKGHSVILVTEWNHVPAYGELDSQVQVESLPFKGGSALSYYLNVVACSRIVSRIQPDVINVHYASGYGTLSRLARLPKTVLSVWGSDVYSFPYRSWLHKRILEKNLRYASTIASTSVSMADRIREVLNTNMLSIPVTPFGIEIDKFTNVVRDSPKNDEEIVLGTVKILKSIYGLKYLIEASSIVHTHLLKTGDSRALKVLIFGDGPDREPLENLSAELGLLEVVQFMGSIPNSEVPRAISMMDIFVLPSIEESFGVAAVEAMASSKPVIVSDAGGLREVVGNGQAGMIVPRQNSGALAEAILSLMDDQESLRKYGEQGRKRVEDEYTFSKNADTLLECLWLASIR